MENQSGDGLTEVWTTIIRPPSGWFDISVLELWHHRDLIALFVRRDFVAQFKQTILGPLWFGLQPLLMTVVFTIVFGKIAKIPTDGIPEFLFYLSGTVCWSYFSACVTETSNTFLANAGILGKVYFPRLIIPISIVISNMIKFSIQFVIFLFFLVYFWKEGLVPTPGAHVLALPLLVAQMALIGLGCGIIISSLTTKYRDLQVLVGFGVQLWLYATPVVYPLSSVPERFRSLYTLNPMVSVVEGFRWAFLGTGSLSAVEGATSIVITLCLVALGVTLFSRIEKQFMDTV
jgi:lipopolysaccharide transport system permease protein